MENNIYYPINESNARTAHDMMSFSDYSSGSTTAAYRGEVNKAYELADRAAAAKPNEAERVYRLADRYSRKLAEYYNREASIGMMCPSVMISGSGNFPIRKKEKQMAAWGRNNDFYKYVQSILKKIESILYGKEIIKSDDERAVEKLEEKLEDLKQSQEQMKAANKAIRLKNTEDGDDLLRELGYSEADIKKLREPDFCGRIGYPDYALTNNNANIHRIEKRITDLKAIKDKGTSEQDYGTFRVVENSEAMRLQVFFDGKPDAEIREVLKSEAFRWAPSNGCWQRQLTASARYAVKRIIERITK